MAYWKLQERPFEATWDSRFFYGSHQHLEALNRLLYFVGEQTMNAFLLTGDTGCGKTLTRAVFTRQLDPGQHLIITLENSGFSFGEIVEAILLRLDPSSLGQVTSTMARCEHLASLLNKIRAQGRHVVLVLDEAQDMSAQTLHELRWLTNFNGAGQACLSLVIIGQTEIQNLIRSDVSMDQRVSLRFHLGTLPASDSRAYLAHRLRVAGHETGDLFTTEAADALHTFSGGKPRELNRLAKLSLEHAWVTDQDMIDSHHIEAVVNDLQKHQMLAVA